MSHERINPETDVRQATVSIPDAYRIVWDAGNMALANESQPEAVNMIMSDEIVKIFSKLDGLQEESAVIAPALPDGETPKITVGILLAELDQEKREIYDYQTLISSRPVNPFLIHDDRLQAIDNLSFYIQVAHNGLTETP